MQFYKVDMDENINRLQWLFSIFLGHGGKREAQGTGERAEDTILQITGAFKNQRVCVF